MATSDRLLDQALPHWDVSEKHARDVHAPVAAVWDALWVTPVADLPVTRALMQARALGRSPLGDRSRPALRAFPPGEVARRDGTELLLGLVAPTSLRTPVAPVERLRPTSVAALRRPLPDGWVRIAMDFRLQPAGDVTRLHTETRVLATGPRAKRFFRVYWLIVRGGSGLIRREMLRAVARRAEAAGG